MGEMWRGRDNVRVSLRPPFDARTVISAVIPGSNFAALLLAAIGIATLSRSGLMLANVALLLPAMLIAARGSLLVRREGPIREIPRALAVAAAYELGRAAAVVARGAAYRRRRSEVS
jgi:hypothetical protein